MFPGLAIGLGLLAIAAVLIYTALPDKTGESPRHLRFHAATVVYPPLVLAFLVAGIVQVFVALY